MTMKNGDFKVNGKWNFCRVKCKGYMKKVNDGRHVIHDDDGWWYADNTKHMHPDSYETWTKKIEDIPTNKEFLKTYYERKEKEFYGVAVGIKRIIVSAYLGVENYDYDTYGEKVAFVYKDPEETAQCIIVYYAQNKSRLVLLDDIELDGETCIIKAKGSQNEKERMIVLFI